MSLAHCPGLEGPALGLCRASGEVSTGLVRLLGIRHPDGLTLCGALVGFLRSRWQLGGLRPHPLLLLSSSSCQGSLPPLKALVPRRVQLSPPAGPCPLRPGRPVTGQGVSQAAAWQQYPCLGWAVWPLLASRLRAGRGARGAEPPYPEPPREGGMFSPLVLTGCVGVIGSRGVPGLGWLHPHPAVQPGDGWTL